MRPSFTAAVIEAKLSSARIISAASFVTSVPLMPIAENSDVGFLQRWGVVDAPALKADIGVAMGLEVGGR